MTCTPWCAWQNYNLKNCDRVTVEKIKKARVESEEMINILYDLVRNVLDDTDVEPYVHFAFEWPRWCRGWNLEVVNKLRSYFAYTAEFDGCRFGLQDTHGDLLRKPWRVVTTLKSLAEALVSCTAMQLIA